MSDHMTDLDLPPAYRTQANLWKAEYFKALREIAKANKGIRRLKNGRRRRSADLSGVYDGIEWFGAWLVDHAEGETITEELIHRWACEAWSEFQKTIHERTK